MIIQGVSYPSDFEAKKQINELGKYLEAKSYAIGGEGSISVRVGPNAVWMTLAEADKCNILPDKLVRVDMNGKTMPGAGSRTARLPEDFEVHLQAYRENPALRAVVHAYPAGAVICAQLGRGIEPAGYSPAVRALGRMQLLNESSPEAAAKAAALSCKQEGGLLTRDDGCYVWAESLTDCRHKLDAVEYYVKIARALCGAGKSACSGNCAACGTPCGRAVSPAPAAVPAPAPAYTPAPAPQPMPAVPGLTGLIRPGQPFPAPEAAPAAPAPAPRPTPAPAAVRTDTKAHETPRVAQMQATVIPAGTMPVTEAPKPDVMAEVVRRSLKAMH